MARPPIGSLVALLCVMTLAAAVLGPVEEAQADETAPDPELRYDLRIDLPVTLGQAALLGTYAEMSESDCAASGVADSAAVVSTAARDAAARMRLDEETFTGPPFATGVRRAAPGGRRNFTAIAVPAGHLAAVSK